MRQRKINSYNKLLVNNASVTRIFIVLLPFTLMELISGCSRAFFTHFKDSNIESDSYTHLDVYKRQVLFPPIALGIVTFRLVRGHC